uniref:ATP synthase F0 subunit 8 n=1 Tax=Augilodes binghami TaxID=2886263 RepID=UPI001E753C3B|nr:ATP synthase F0 subunit 8 [Augilodes binghami]UDL72048.1 ATP synthase F0 subunit 8 [Augilodes binghami]
MPQMSPMWWITIMITSSMLTMQVMTNLMFDKEKLFSTKKKKKKNQINIKW